MVTEQLLRHKNKLVCIVIGVVTGNCPIGVNLKNWRIMKDDYCRECNEEEETLEHLLCRCSALRNRRSVEIGQDFLDGLEDAAELEIQKLLNFAKGWKCLRRNN